jgi:formylglycine-generating enzyme required for sulfatase activity/predicted Ser/Thr protein kinase
LNGIVSSHSSSSAKGWEPPSVEELSAQLPQYQIEALMGRGGMGAVYKGRQTSLDRPVAIKILSNQLEDADTSFAERFKNEARALGKLSHPGIVGVYDFGEAQGGLLYIVMEFIDGTDVAKMISKNGRLHTEHAMAITAHVCDALAYAHERGIIHRDIKPANIMVGYDGVVKVADFGLAKMTQSTASGLTQSGMAMGTLHYMAPEALTLGSAVDQRADIYAVGVMLYQMITGKLPQGMFEMPSLQIKGLDPRYDRIVATAMRDDRELRYPSAKALRLELDAILTQPVAKVEASAKEAQPALNTQARPKRPDWQPPQPVKLPPVRQMKRSWPYTSILLATLCVAAGWIYWQRSGYRFVVEPTQVQPQGKNQRATAASGIPPIVSRSSMASATKEAPFINTLGMRLVPVPGTNVLFCIHETRRADYESYAAANSGVNESFKFQHYDGVPCGHEESHPVVGIDWEDAQKFCDWLSKKEGKKYRLPTDEEWSIAVGLAGKEKHGKSITPEMLSQKEQTLFPWEDDYPPKGSVGNYADESWHEKYPAKPWIEKYNDRHATTAPVMSFKPNKLGLYDLGGNAWEIVEDWFDEKKTSKTARGHSYINTPSLAALRARIEKRKTCAIGFRCVLELPVLSPAISPLPGLDNVANSTAVEPTPKSTVEQASGMKPTTTVTASLPKGPTSWTDIQGRTLVATFKAIQGDTVLLEIDGKTQPVAMAKLSAASQKLARDYLIPTPLRPGLGELMDNGSPDRRNDTNDIQFGWSAVPEATKYEIEAWGPGATYPLVRKEVTETEFKRSDDGYVGTCKGWHWKVRAFVQNQWQAWCEDVSFEFEPPGYDLTIHAQQARTVLPAAPKAQGQDDTTQKVLKTAVTPPEFVRIPGGTFFMGSTSGDATENDARPERVTASEFYLQATETTKAQWDEVRTWALSNGYRDMAPADGKAPNHPVHSVSWWDAVRWCNARSEKEGLKPVYTVFGEVMRSGTVEPVADWTANGYRLPTEAEWEKAARGGATGKRFPWGADTISHTHANFRNDGGEAYVTGSTFYHPRYNDGQAPYTSPVASFKANNFGLHDMAGNVWEWCWERYTDSRLPTGEKRVLRGGSWDFYANSCTAANRGHEMPANRVNRHGFRPARSSIP